VVADGPTRLISRSVGVLVIVSGFLIGIAAFDFDWTYLFVQKMFAYIPDVLAALLVLFVGNVFARFLGRSVLIGAVDLNLQYARLLSVGVKWIVIVLAFAMALEHLRIAPGIVELAFGILLGGIVLTLALAVGLSSKDLIAKSVESDVKKASSEALEDPLRHL
jgi:Conserved TM helix